MGLYRGSQPADSELPRVFGGQVAAQALMAAQLTVPDERHVHSLHLYFILGGDPSIPIVYDVENVRDGGSFTTRRVAARQHGEIIFYMTASFQVVEDGWDHQDAMPDVPSPDESIPLTDLIGGRGSEAAEHWKREWSSFDMRYIGDNRADDDPQRQLVPVVQRLWFRADGTLPDSQIVHNAAFTYISDLSLLGASLVPHGSFIGAPDVQPASLDHVIWFHRPIVGRPVAPVRPDVPVGVGRPRVEHGTSLHRGRHARRDRRPGGPDPPRQAAQLTRRRRMRR